MAISPLNTANNIFNINAAGSKRETVAPQTEASYVNSSQESRLNSPHTGEAMTPQESEELFQQITSQPYWNRHDVNFYSGPPVAMKLTEKPSAAADDFNSPESISASEALRSDGISATANTRLYNPQTDEAITPEEAEQLFQQLTSQSHWYRNDVNFYSRPPATHIIAAEKQSPTASEVKADYDITGIENSNRPVESAHPATFPAVYGQSKNTASLNKYIVKYQTSETAETSNANISLWNKNKYDYYQLWLETLAGNYSYDNEEAGKIFLSSSERCFWDVKV